MTASSSVPAPGGNDVVHRVELAATGLAGIQELPAAEAVTRFEALHRELQGALADLDPA